MFSSSYLQQPSSSLCSSSSAEEAWTADHSGSSADPLHCWARWHLARSGGQREQPVEKRPVDSGCRPPQPRQGSPAEREAPWFRNLLVHRGTNQLRVSLGSQYHYAELRYIWQPGVKIKGLLRSEVFPTPPCSQTQHNMDMLFY